MENFLFSDHTTFLVRFLFGRFLDFPGTRIKKYSTGIYIKQVMWIEYKFIISADGRRIHTSYKLFYDVVKYDDILTFYNVNGTLA